MSVYRPKRKDGSFASPFFHYDFEFNRHRFFGSTGAKTRKVAEQVERLKRIEADKAADETSIAGAFGRFWIEVGQHDRSSDVTFYRLEWLQGGLTAVLAEAGKTAALNSVSTWRPGEPQINDHLSFSSARTRHCRGTVDHRPGSSGSSRQPRKKEHRSCSRKQSSPLPPLA